ncbi:hypothetical protein [Cytobacillus sp. IB215316]|nr:hypothetical protein [Cytobacillus sp. IB215316]MDX8362725.1 hypothetical protein [Cytobacillus sp. IB215316]
MKERINSALKLGDLALPYNRAGNSIYEINRISFGKNITIFINDTVNS